MQLIKKMAPQIEEPQLDQPINFSNHNALLCRFFSA